MAKLLFKMWYLIENSNSDICTIRQGDIEIPVPVSVFALQYISLFYLSSGIYYIYVIGQQQCSDPNHTETLTYWYLAKSLFETN